MNDAGFWRAQYLYNVESLGPAPEEIIFVDREIDVCSLIDCDITHAVSFDGPVTADTEALRAHAEILRNAKRIVLAGTHSPEGEIKREAIASRLGRHRCHLVQWPAPYTCAEQTFLALGQQGIVRALYAAKPYPIDGLHQISGERLLALRNRPPPGTMDTGVGATDAILKIPTEGRLIVVTGYPASGKTSWTRHIIVHTAQHHNRRWAVFSPEMSPWEQFCADCSEVLIGKPFWPYTDRTGRRYEAMSLPEVEIAGRWLERRLTMIVCDSGDDAPTLPWVLEKATDAIMRDGVTDVLIDPWNEIEHTRDRNMSETDYIGRALQQIKAKICQRHGANAWVIAHPVKPIRSSGGDPGPPGPYEISGSAHFANKTDLGITLHALTPHARLMGPDGARDIQRSSLTIWKARFRRFGVKNSDAVMDFDPSCGRFSNPSDFDEPMPDDED